MKYLEGYINGQEEKNHKKEEYKEEKNHKEEKDYQKKKEKIVLWDAPLNRI
ncbi:hypothetical protein J7K24_02640 [bacterium]|nr:hypothetical protein [bacterium]